MKKKKQKIIRKKKKQIVYEEQPKQPTEIKPIDYSNSCFKKDVNKKILGLMIIHLLVFTAMIIYFDFKVKSLNNQIQVMHYNSDKTVDKMVIEQLAEIQKVKSNANNKVTNFETLYYECEKEK